MTEQQITYNGIGFFGLLTIVFITLKLCSVVNWSWWLVFAPLWMPVCFLLIVVIIILFVIGILHLISR